MPFNRLLASRQNFETQTDKPFRAAGPEELRMLRDALERYCHSAGIEPGTVEHENAAILLIDLFTSGAATADELVSAAEISESRRRATP